MAEGEQYEVEYVWRARRVGLASEHVEYLVHWVGYPEDEDTWEPAENLAGCERLLASFWAAVDDICINDPITDVTAPLQWRKAESATARDNHYNRIRRSQSITSSRSSTDAVLENQLEDTSIALYNEFVSNDIDSSSEAEASLCYPDDLEFPSGAPNDANLVSSWTDTEDVDLSDTINPLLYDLRLSDGVKEPASDEDIQMEPVDRSITPFWTWTTSLTVSVSPSFVLSSKATFSVFTESIPQNLLLSISNLIPDKIYNPIQAMAILRSIEFMEDHFLICPLQEEGENYGAIYHLFHVLKTLEAVITLNAQSPNEPHHIPGLKFLAFTSSSSLLSCMQSISTVTSASEDFKGIVLIPISTDHKQLKNISLEISHGNWHLLPYFQDLVQGRSFCIWSSPIDPLPTAAGCKFAVDICEETSMLLYHLAKYGAHNVGYNSDNTYLVFIHRGALHSIGRLSYLAERRKNKKTRFIVYGSSLHFSPCDWKMKEIFPIGGIITFTPSALLEDPITIIQYLRLIDKHPLWMVYISISVLGLLEYLSDESLLEARYGEYNIDTEIIKFLLLQIHILHQAGKVALLDRLPLDQTEAKALSWISSQIHLHSAELFSQILLEHFDSIFKDKNLEKLFLAHTIEKDLLWMSFGLQMRKEIMENYRRFIIFKGRNEGYLSNNVLYGLEFLKLNECPW